MKQFFRNNGLSIVFFLLFLLSLLGQTFTGMQEHNKERKEDGQPPVNLVSYLQSGHFIQATFENWESEFLQMALFVLLTISLRQKGSAESKEMEEETPKATPSGSAAKKDAPWPVRKGGWILKLYENSLSIAFLILFLLSFALHFYGSFKDENEQLVLKHQPTETFGKFIVDPRFWFESFQNWQSEFLSVFAIVVLSIYLRQKGSAQSKDVDAPDSQTGD